MARAALRLLAALTLAAGMLSLGGCNDNCIFALDGACDEDGPFPVCGAGTDSTDCRGDGGGGCSDTCTWATDGECDDGGANASGSACDFGTDCGDCGAR